MSDDFQLPSHQVFQQILLNLSDQNPKNQSVLRLQIQTLKEKLQQKQYIINSMNEELNSLKSPSDYHNQSSNLQPQSFIQEQDILNITKKNKDKYLIHNESSNHQYIQNQINITQQSVQSDYTQMRQRYRLIENQTRYLKQQLNELFKSKQCESEALNSIIDNLKLKIQNQKLYIQELENKKKDQNQVFQGYQNILQQKQEQTNELEQKINQLQNQLKIHQELYIKKQNQIQEMMKDNNQIMDQFQQKIQVQREKCQKLDQQKQKLIKEFDIQRMINKQSIQKVQVKYSKILKERDNEIQNKNNQLNEANQKMNKLLNELILLRKQKQVKRQHIQKQNRLILQHQKKYQQVEKEIRVLNKTLQQKNEILNQYQNQLQEYSNQIIQLKEQINDNQIKSQQIKQRISLIYTEKYKKNIEKFVNFIREIMSSFKNQLNDLKISTKNNIKNAHTQLKDHFVGFNLLVQKITQNKQEKPRNSNNINQSSFFNREQVLQFQIQELKKEILQLKSENFELKYERKKYEDKKKNKQQQKDLIQSLRLQIQKLNSKLKSQQDIIKVNQQKILKKQPIQKIKVNQESLELLQYPNKTAKDKNLKAQRRRKQSQETDEKIIHQINEMRKRIKYVRQECNIRHTQK